jgi:hypothetical protein
MKPITWVKKAGPFLIFLGKPAALLAILGLVIAGVLFLRSGGPEIPLTPAYRLEPRPTPQALVFGTIPQIHAQIRSLNFYSSLINGDTKGEHHYSTQFDKNQTGYIYWTIAVKYPAPSQSVDVPLHYLWYRPDGGIFDDETITLKVDSGYTDYIESVWSGWKEPGHWLSGLYRLEIYSEGNLVATGSFEIVP